MASAPGPGGLRSPPLMARLLNGSIAIILRRFGPQTSSEDEIRGLLREGVQTGIFEEAEHEMVERVFLLSDRRASELMTPMKAIVWLDVADTADVLKRKITESPHSRFPVCEGCIDNILGIVQVKDLLVHTFSGQAFGFKGLLKMPLLIYEGTPGLKVLAMFKDTGVHVAIVLDEYGSVRGMLTLNDILEAIIGDMPVGADALNGEASGKRP